MMKTLAHIPALVVLAASAAALHACASKQPATPQAMAQRDTDQAAHLALQAQTLMDKGKWADAIDLNQRSIATDPSLGAVWLNLGVCLMETQDNQRAAQCFQKAAELSPLDPKPFENLALLHMKLGWHEDALRIYEMSLERSQFWLPSLRGSVQAAKELNRSTDAGLDRIKNALLVEKDAAWRRVFAMEQVRVAQDLAERDKRERRAN